MEVEADRKCFVCGPENPIGLQADFKIDAETQTAEASLVISENYQGWQGVVHGGILSALLDEAAIYACRPISLHAVTASLNVRFRKPVTINNEFSVQARVVSVKRKIAEVYAKLECHGEVMAEADVKVMLLAQSGED